MNRTYLSAAVAFVSAILLLFTAHPVFFLTLIGSSCYFGWTGARDYFGETDEV